jgi:hypothetical protein
MARGHGDVHGDGRDKFYFDDDFGDFMPDILSTGGIAWQKSTSRKRKLALALDLRDFLEPESSASADSLLVLSMAMLPFHPPANA